MLELANLGAAVLHPRAVEYAKNYQVPLVVRSSFSDNSGTHVKGESIMEQGIVVRGIACDKNVARISILGVEDLPGILGRVFTALADEQINVDIIVQSGVQDGVADFAFTVSLSDEHRAMTVLKEIRSEITYQEATSEKDLVKISIVGAGMVSHFGVAAKMFNVISQQGVSIKMVSTSEIRVSCVIDSVHQNEVLKQLHTAFGLDTDGQAIIGGPEVRR